MFNYNSGYDGFSRSKNSSEAIANYEVPKSMITKSMIEDFIADNYDENTKEYKKLMSIPACLWKFGAQPTSWHHVGKYFKEVDHYSLHTIAANLLEQDIEQLKKEYKAYKEQEKEDKKTTEKNYKYGVVRSQVWGGTRNHPKIIDRVYIIGIIFDNWIYYYEDNKYDTYKKLKKANIYANKIEMLKQYETYSELVKQFPEYKNNKKLFNTIVKNKLKK